MKFITISSFLCVLMFAGFSFAQLGEYRVHDRGMLHETVYNTGEIGRPWQTGLSGYTTNLPLFEWPSNSNLIVNNIKYSGQHNLIGAGMYISANIMGRPGTSNRLYSFCGGVGSSSPELSYGKWSFPLSMDKIQNYPVLSDGRLNSQYNPNEAEEIIIAKWATNIGITVTRTSRAWSYPDYDDMIIYEYEMEYTGDTDGNPATIERDSTLSDVMFTFTYGMAPSMYGYERWWDNKWQYEGGMYRGDQRNFFDASLWLSFNMNLQTKNDTDLAFKPEPDPASFLQFSKTKENGGGLCSPQAPGYCILYYDTTHLAICNPFNPVANESEATPYLINSSEYGFYELDQNLHIRQPFRQKIGTGSTSSSKMVSGQGLNPNERSNPYKPVSATWPIPPDGWIGRSAYNYRQSNDAVQKFMVFGPYTMHKGDKVKFALAEVVGYGAQAGKSVEGGQTLTQWAPIPSLNKKIVINGQVMTEHYLTDFGYPDYVNSNVKTVQDAAIKSFEAYRGQDTLNLPAFPEQSPSSGSYKIPVPFPAPAIVVSNTSTAEIIIKWGRNVESFTHPRLIAPLSGFKIYRSKSAMGPWDSLSSYSVGDGLNSDNQYEFVDRDQNFKVGETRFYAVTSVDIKGNESGKTNITQLKKNLAAADKLGKVYVVPNPFIQKSGFTGSGDVATKIGFYGLPERCTIRIFSYSGQLVWTIEHNEPFSTEEWFQTSINGQEMASGIYFYVVTTPQGDKSSGKFVIIR